MFWSVTSGTAGSQWPTSSSTGWSASSLPGPSVGCVGGSVGIGGGGGKVGDGTIGSADVGLSGTGGPGCAPARAAKPATSAKRRRRRHITSPEQVEHELQAGIDDVELGRIGVVLDEPAALERQRLLDRQAQLGADVR